MKKLVSFMVVLMGCSFLITTNCESHISQSESDNDMNISGITYTNKVGNIIGETDSSDWKNNIDNIYFSIIVEVPRYFDFPINIPVPRYIESDTNIIKTKYIHIKNNCSEQQTLYFSQLDTPFSINNKTELNPNSVDSTAVKFSVSLTQNNYDSVLSSINYKETLRVFNSNRTKSKNIPLGEIGLKQSPFYKNHFGPAFPNPADSIVNLPFELEWDDKVSLKIFDSKNNLKKILIDNKKMNKGIHNIKWDVRNIEKELYRAQLKIAGDIIQGGDIKITGN